MQIVIDVPEYMYNDIKNCGYAYLYAKDIALCVIGGTPLPKGHGRLIDADRVITEATERMKYPANHQYMECVIAHMKLAPTIIEADTESEDKE